MKNCKELVEDLFNSTPDAEGDKAFSQSTFLKRFGAAIAERRRFLNMTQEEFAAGAGLNRTYISDVERGARNVRTTKMIEIAHALKLPAWALILRAEQDD